jgi:hypothetical protein
VGKGTSMVVMAAVLCACAPPDDRAPGGEGGDGAAAALASDRLVAPVCQPSDRMDVAGRPSPYDSASIAIGQGTAKVCYGRPFLRGRTMIGGEAVPYDTLWRTGANEPTTLHLNVPARIAGIEVAPGSYSLYTVPRETEPWTLIVNRSTSQWGHESEYTEAVRAQEVGRAEVTAETAESRVEQLTFRTADSGGALLLEWQDVRVRIPVESG